jgi:hypothetical protein
MTTQRVSKEEFERFLATYPRKLERDVARMCGPPLVSYNDFTLGNWPQSVVASHSFADLACKMPAGWKVRKDLV